MAGRAGRLGFSETGKAIMLADTPMERAQLFQRYVLGVPEGVKSSFHPNDLPTWTLRLLSQIRGIRADEIPTLLVNTFGGYSASRDNPQWSALVVPDITNLVTRLLETGLAEMDGDLMHLTLLGRACGSSSLQFESSLRLIELSRNLDASQTPAGHMLAIIQVLDELDDVYTPIAKKENTRPSEVMSRFGNDIVRMLQRHCRDQAQLWARCKRAALLYDWIEGTSIDTLEERYSTKSFTGRVGYGDIIGMADATRFHLRSAHEILGALFPEQSDFLGGLDEILLRLEFGLPSSALPLMDIPVQLTRGQYLALLSVGVHNIDEIKNLDNDQLCHCVGENMAALLRSIDDSSGNTA